jgi:hypothetical protein
MIRQMDKKTFGRATLPEAALQKAFINGNLAIWLMAKTILSTLEADRSDEALQDLINLQSIY